MGRPLIVCPVHCYERILCGRSCAAKRRAWSKICHQFSTYWYDRRRGVAARHYKFSHQPIWEVWKSA